MLFRSTYHSLRFVNDLLVMRLNRELSDEKLRRLNRDFRKMVHKGKIWTTDEPLEEEANQPELKDMPRLIFHFNRRDCALLRKMIDVVNEAE